MAFVNPRQKHRNTTSALAARYGKVGEIAVDLTKKTAVVMDGVTAGGFALAREDMSNVSLNSLDLSGNTTILGRTLSGTSSTPAATAAKTVVISGLVIVAGVRIIVNFTSGNSNGGALTLNVNSTSNDTIYSESGLAVSATNLAYFPSDCNIEFYRNAANTGWVYVNKVVKPNYTSGAYWYNVWSNGWVEQGGAWSIGATNSGVTGTTTITLPITMLDTSYHVNAVLLGLNNLGQEIIVSRTTSQLTVGFYSQATGATRNGLWEVKGRAII